MADRPLILPGWAVRAVLREIEAPGTGKSQHRVIIKNRGMLPDFRGPNGCQADPECWGWEDGESGYHIGIVPSSDGDYQDFWQPSAAGDRLWVRETFWRSSRYPFTMPCGEASPPSMNWGRKIHYAADGKPENTPNRHYPEGLRGKNPAAPNPDAVWLKLSSAIMPRWASRLTLLVSNVRVHRVQDITEEDARAEGVEEVTRQVASGDPSLRFWRRYRDGGWNSYVDTAAGSFASLWTEQHGSGSWERNPWVVALTFRPIPRNIDMEA